MPKVQVTKAEMWLGIKLKCMDCVGHEDYRRRIRECDSAHSCGIWKYRPYQNGGKGNDSLD